MFIIKSKLKYTFPLCFILFLVFCDINFMFDIYSNEYEENKLIIENKTQELNLDLILEQKLVFITGYRGSGSDIVKEILSAHESVKCLNDHILIHEIISYIKDIKRNPSVNVFMDSSGIDTYRFQRAIGLFFYYYNILDINLKNKNQVICIESSDLIHYMDFLRQVFPNSKFIYIQKNVKEAIHFEMMNSNQKLDFNLFFEYAIAWNSVNNLAYRQCVDFGENNCKLVNYKNLIENPTDVSSDLIQFLNLTYEEDKFAFKFCEPNKSSLWQKMINYFIDQKSKTLDFQIREYNDIINNQYNYLNLTI